MTTGIPSKINTAVVMLKVIGWLSIAFGAFFMLMFFAAGAFLGRSSDEGTAFGAAIFGVIGLGIGVCAVGFGVLHLFTARGIAERKPWAKVCAIVLAALSVVNVPVGTVMAVFIFIGLLSDEATDWFAET